MGRSRSARPAPAPRIHGPARRVVLRQSPRRRVPPVLVTAVRRGPSRGNGRWSRGRPGIHRASCDGPPGWQGFRSAPHPGWRPGRFGPRRQGAPGARTERSDRRCRGSRGPGRYIVQGQPMRRSPGEHARGARDRPAWSARRADRRWGRGAGSGPDGRSAASSGTGRRAWRSGRPRRLVARLPPPGRLRPIPSSDRGPRRP